MLWSRIRTVEIYPTTASFPSRQRYSSCLAQPRAGNPHFGAAGMDRIGRYDFLLLVPIRLVVWIPLIAGGQSWLCPNSITRIAAFRTTNSIFQHFRKFAVNPRAGLVFWILLLAAPQLIGQTTIRWNLDDPIHSTGGLIVTGTLRSRSGWRQICSSPLHWEFLTSEILLQGNYKDLTFRTKPFDFT